jgi:hypothetical protein
MTEFDNSEDDILASEDLEAIDKLDGSIIARHDQLDARRKLEDMLEEQALKKLLDDESYYDFI